jgi:hypothetical protein
VRQFEPTIIAQEGMTALTLRLRPPRRASKWRGIGDEKTPLGEEEAGRIGAYLLLRKNVQFVPIRNSYVACFQRLDFAGVVFCVPINFLFAFFAVRVEF